MRGVTAATYEWLYREFTDDTDATWLYTCFIRDLSPEVALQRIGVPPGPLGESGFGVAAYKIISILTGDDLRLGRSGTYTERSPSCISGTAEDSRSRCHTLRRRLSTSNPTVAGSNPAGRAFETSSNTF
ncbi:hypothetical protein SAMN05421874_1742 [Nonomuraea maritima]|uniref:Uncharacterized protein n=1 Tax=Nonomuraea maritima TaxID=683260 RepID=A0A1G9SX85_9ACTN|nr:hypothetical protein [Nonomuraea maritima]SDM40022.1 hypothetical protein SAMN05421874_1742 [Nonomuraea maritima]